MGGSSGRRIVLAANSSWNIVNFRAGLIRALRDAGYDVVVVSPRDPASSARMPKVLLITSTRSGEGKSSTALALAQNFARRDRRVLLIDSDLRKPAFKAATDKIGLTKLLTNDELIDGHIVETQHANLSLLPSGPVPPNPADLLSTGRIRAILGQASERFDLVVVDAPPTLGLADAPLLAAAAGNAMRKMRSLSSQNSHSWR